MTGSADAESATEAVAFFESDAGLGESGFMVYPGGTLPQCLCFVLEFMVMRLLSVMSPTRILCAWLRAEWIPISLHMHVTIQNQ
jgi:hypothetical protein